MGKAQKEKTLIASWVKDLSRIENEANELLRCNLLGNGGTPKVNSVIIAVNYHAQQALLILKGVLD